MHLWLSYPMHRVHRDGLGPEFPEIMSADNVHGSLMMLQLSGS